MGGQPLADYRVHDDSMTAQISDRPAVKDQVISSIEERHPWVAVARPAGRLRPRLRLAAAADSAVGGADTWHPEHVVEETDPPLVKQHERHRDGD